MASFFAAMFERVSFPEERAVELRALGERGSLVYVMRWPLALSLSYFEHAYAKRSLPRPTLAWGPIGGPWTRVVRCASAEQLAAGVKEGGNALIFLRGGREGKAKEDPFVALARVAREGRPIFLVPQVIVWERHPGTVKGGLLGTLLGAPETPNALRTAGAFLYFHRHAHAKIGQAIDLNAFCAAQGDVSDELLARKVRGALGYHLAHESRQVTGPRLKPHGRMMDEVLRDRTLRGALDELAHEGGEELATLEKQAKAALGEIAARFNPTAVEFLKPLADRVLARLSGGVVVDRPGLERVRAAATHSALVLCPSHKSHLDYVVLSKVLYDEGFTPPHVAAGVNLSFFPLGPLFRRGGAFFLRRSFKGDRVYASAFRAYIKRLMRDGFTQEFFIEGGRSRTGKLLTPKLGLLSMEVDAWLEGARGDVSFVPIAIDYEKIPEGRAYARELAGGDKPKETFGALLKTRKMLRSRHGRIYLQVDEPISLQGFFAARGVDPADHTAEQRRALVQALAHRIVYGISRAETITPVALLAGALLAHQQRGLSASAVADRVSFLRNLADRTGARLSPDLHDAPATPDVEGPLQAALDLLAEEGQVRWTRVSGVAYLAAVEEGRVSLSFYKNALLTACVAPSLVATALLSFKDAPPSLEQLRARTLWLSRLFKFEFTYRTGATFGQIFDETIALCAALGLIDSSAERVHPVSIAARERLELLRDLTRDFLESYWIACDGLDELRGVEPLEAKDLIARSLARGKKALEAGRLSRPEALSRPNLENALHAFRDLDVIDGDKQLQLTAGFAHNPEELGSLRAEIERLLA
jgi:glycerol-3-phosphate O-acyltransferase